jgi:ferritin-like metal-binding protein YciE
MIAAGLLLPCTMRERVEKHLSKIGRISQPKRDRAAPICKEVTTSTEVPMGLLTPNDIKNLQSLYIMQLRYLLSTENQIVKGLRSMIEHSSDIQLQQAFQSHLQETEVHVARLEKMIGDVNAGDVDDKKDPIITAMLGSGENIVKESDAGPARDAGLIASAQKVEHYEIASYGSARDWAKILGLQEHVELLQKTLNEEKHADELLTSISARTNTTAAAAA